MSGEAPKTKNDESPQVTEWDSLAGYDAIKQNLQDEFLNIEDMLKSGRINEDQAEKFRAEVTARANDEKQLQDLLEQKEQSPEEDFAGEQNFNAASGKERTFSEWDLYPRQKGETSAAYGERLRKMHELTAQAEQEAKVTQEAGERANLGAHAKADTEEKLKLERAAHAKLEAEARAKLELEEKAKLERAQHAKREAEDVAAHDEKARAPEEISAKIKQIEAKQQEIDVELSKRGEGLVSRIDQKLAEINRTLGIEDESTQTREEDAPLVAINADFTHDKREFARTQAEQELNDELSTAGFIKRIWKGNLFRKYYQKKYEREYLSGERVIIKDGEEVDVDDVIADRSGSAIKRFVLGATDEYRDMVHTRAGESLTEADAHTTETVKDAIEWFASAEVPEGGSMSDLTLEFGNRIKRLQAEGRDQGKPVDETLINNYYEVAMQARQRAEHGASMDRVMDGFKVYNAEVRDGMRTETHRDNIDRIIDKIEGSKIGQVVPAEAIAAAVGTAVGITQTGARAVFGIAGALGVAGISQGLRARNRVTEDRARMMRDVASGYEYDGTTNEAVEGHAAKQRTKYEARIGGTLYDIRSANDLTQNLTTATKSGNPDDIIRAIAEARTRINYSDSERKDLIGYSSDDAKGDERLALDLAVIRAENSLSDHDREDVAFMNGYISHHLAEEIDAKDSAFKRLRAAEAVKAAGKSIAFGAAAFFGSQELISAIDPAKLGLLEKVGLLRTENADDASETIIASLAGPRTTHPGSFPRLSLVENIEGDRTVEIERYQEMGYQQIEIDSGYTETNPGVVSVDPSASNHQIRVAYDGWANNGTTISDSNELNVSLANGQFTSSMSGNSTMGGQVFNYDQLATDGRIKGYVTVGGAKFEVASTLDESGQLAWGNNGTFTTTTGETIKAFGDNGEKLYQYFEIALDNGTDADGVTHIMPFATDVGANTFDGTIDQIAETVTEQPATYDFVKWEWASTEIPNDVTYGGAAIPGVTSRVGVGTAYNSEPTEPTTPEALTVDPAAETVSLTPIPETPTLEPIPEPAPEPEPEQPANPEPIPEAEPEPSEPTSEPEAPTEPETASTQPESPEDAFKAQIREQLGSLIGDEGVDFMTTRERGEGDSLRIANWWNSLSDEARDAVVQYETNPEHPEYGGNTLRAWLQAQGLIAFGPNTTANAA